MPLVVLRLNATEVPNAGSAVNVRIGIENFVPLPGKGESQPVVVMGDSREVDDTCQHTTFGIPAQPGEGVVLGVVGIDPFEATRAR